MYTHLSCNFLKRKFLPNIMRLNHTQDRTFVWVNSWLWLSLGQLVCHEFPTTKGLNFRYLKIAWCMSIYGNIYVFFLCVFLRNFSFEQSDFFFFFTFFSHANRLLIFEKVKKIILGWSALMLYEKEQRL